MHSTVTITPIAAGDYIFTLTTPEDVETYNQTIEEKISHLQVKHGFDDPRFDDECRPPALTLKNDDNGTPWVELRSDDGIAIDSAPLPVKITIWSYDNQNCMIESL